MADQIEILSIGNWKSLEYSSVICSLGIKILIIEGQPDCRLAPVHLVRPSTGNYASIMVRVRKVGFSIAHWGSLDGLLFGLPTLVRKDAPRW